MREDFRGSTGGSASRRRRVMLVLMLELLLVVIGRAGAGRLLLAMAMDRTDRSRTTAADGVAAATDGNKK